MEGDEAEVPPGVGDEDLHHVPELLKVLEDVVLLELLVVVADVDLAEGLVALLTVGDTHSALSLVYLVLLLEHLPLDGLVVEADKSECNILVLGVLSLAHNNLAKLFKMLFDLIRGCGGLESEDDEVAAAGGIVLGQVQLAGDVTGRSLSLHRGIDT